MSNILSSEFDEVVIRLTPTPLNIIAESQAKRVSGQEYEQTHSYDVLVYTNVTDIVSLLSESLVTNQIEGVGTTVEVGNAQAYRHAQSLAGLPLAGVERVVVRWSGYQEYLSLFRRGTKDPNRFSDRMFETLSRGLVGLFSPRPKAERPLRIWWSSQTPELDDLPWELVAHANEQSYVAPPNSRVFFVRGLPPNVIAPILPVEEVLRLAVIGDQSGLPSGLMAALHNLPSGIEVTMIGTTDTSLRQALQQTASEGYELAHVVTTGSVSLSYEGFLKDSHSGGSLKQPALGAREISSILLGSRVQVLSLSPSEEVSRPVKPNKGSFSPPSTYRAFAYLAGSTAHLPSVVACLGPMDPRQTRGFWKGFYKSLAESLAIDEAIAGGLRATPGILEPVALFLRHTHSTLFRRRPQERGFEEGALPTLASGAGASDPALINAQLQVSRDTIANITLLRNQYSTLHPSMEEYLKQEQARHSELEAELSPWTSLEEGEPR
ncbi:MAG TPA: hypothetical protein VJ183_10955 [Chloroflexia bacterium]|nr:hypothetical protein [Chloroflexia bacterium]